MPNVPAPPRGPNVGPFDDELFPDRYRGQRGPSTAPSLSPRATTSSPAPSPADASDSEAPSFVSEPSNTSTDQGDTDSLIDASPAEVEARALEFLHDDLAPHPLAAQMLGAAEAQDALGPRITAADLPRRIPKGAEQQDEQQQHAVAFLRKCVDDAQDTDWMFATPPVFAAPGKLDPRGGDAVTRDAADGTAWLDDAFNMESYPAFGDENEHESSDEQGGLQFMDLGAEMEGGFGHTGTPFLRREDENAAGAGFGPGGRGRTGGIVRGVSAMAMD